MPTPAETVFTETAEPTPAATEEPSPYAKDYEILWEMLETEYPYLPYLRDKGIDVDGIRKRYAERVQYAENPDQFITIIEKTLAELKNTAHLGLMNDWMYEEYYYLFVMDPDFSDSQDAKLFREYLLDPGLSEIYVRPTDDAETHEEGVAAFYPEPYVSYYEDCKTIHIKLYSFLHEYVERDSKLVEEAINRYPDAENIIFDIVGNKGGDTFYWLHNLVMPFEGDHAFSFREFFRDTPQNKRWMEIWDVEICSTAEADDAPDWAKDYGLDRYYRDTWEIKGDGTVKSSAKRWVLVNRSVYSASEAFVYFCKATGWATVVGTQTGGDGFGGTPILYQLPNTGLLIRYSNTAGENPDGTMNIEGTKPDIELKQAGIIYLLEIIRNGGAE